MTINLYWRNNSGAKELVKGNLKNMNEAAKERAELLKKKDPATGSALILKENLPSDIEPARIIERPPATNVKEEKPKKAKKSKNKKKKEAEPEIEIDDNDYQPIEPTADTIPEIDQSDDLAEQNENE